MINYFKAFGEIKDCMIMYDKISGKPRGKEFYYYIGFGFLIFKNEYSIDNVLMNKAKHLINGKWV